MRLATWCIRGIKARLPYLRHWLRKRQPDIVALQKTFAATAAYPTEVLLNEGYESVLHTCDGRFANGWGVAVLVRKHSLPKPRVLQEGLPGDPDARFLTVRVGELDFSSVYAPFGNPNKNGKSGALRIKLAWLERLRHHIERRSPESRSWVLAGDLNVVPEGNRWKGALNFGPEERKALKSILELGFTDLYRHCHQDRDVRDYNGFNFGSDLRNPPTSRLHLVLGTQAIAKDITQAYVDLEYRQEIEDLMGEKWAPAAPVVVDLR